LVPLSTEERYQAIVVNVWKCRQPSPTAVSLREVIQITQVEQGSQDQEGLGIVGTLVHRKKKTPSSKPGLKRSIVKTVNTGHLIARTVFIDQQEPDIRRPAGWWWASCDIGSDWGWEWS
jgi:hypothetical protein